LQSTHFQSTNFIIVAFRVCRILLHTILGVVIAAFVLPFVSKTTLNRLLKWWCDGLLRCFHIKVKTFGNLPPASTTGVMFVANHVSWADIHSLNSQIPLRFIAKSDIKNWPVFGYLVGKANTLFIDRAKRQDTGRIVNTTAESLKLGDNLCFFPEGTTTDGTQLLPFKSSVLQAAINANASVWPVAIRYVNTDGSINKSMAYAGDSTLVDSMKAVLNIKNPMAELHFLTPIAANHLDRRALTALAHEAIKTKLAL
jgi:1-acyl-sn-glycerol-3-phosphate acyltransferase